MIKRSPSKAVIKTVLAEMIFLIFICFGFMADSVFAQADIKIILPQDDYPPVELDSNVNIPAVIQNHSYIGIAGFSFLIQYDTSAMELIDIDFSPMDDCNWDYRQHAAIAPDLERIVATAINPVCDFAYGTDTLFYLQFHIKPDSANECLEFPLRFYWIQCGDNILVNTAADSTLVSNLVYDRFTWQFIQENDSLPTIHGAPDSCFLIVPDAFFRLVDFHNGIIGISCIDNIDQTGDINLNNIAYEIADYTTFQNYYLYGPGALDINLQAQLEASDCNKDGIYPALKDLIYLYRVIIGDLVPLPKNEKDETRFFPPTALFVQDTLAQEVYLVFPDSLSAIHLIFDGEIVPSYSGPGEFGYNYDGEATRVLISPEISEAAEAVYQGLFLSYNGNGILDSCEVADWEMRDINSTVRVIGGEPVCGDVNASGMIDIVDAVYLLNYIFFAGDPPAFMASADVNCDTITNLVDAVSIIRYVFTGSPVPCGNCP